MVASTIEGGAGGGAVKTSGFGENWWKKSAKKIIEKEKKIKAPPNLSLYCNTLLTELQRMLFMPSGYKDATLIRQPRTGKC